MKKEEGIVLARKLKVKLRQKGIPVKTIYLYGSVAKGETHPWSDVDIAVVCPPFRPTRHEENLEVSKNRWDIDLRIETICLHPEDFENKYWSLPQEVKKYGIPV